jgi:hypothetical protein
LDLVVSGTDPREANGGGIIGPGGAHDKNAVLIDAHNAVLMDGIHVALMEPYSNGIPRPPIIAMQVDGRINKTKDRANITFLFDEDGAAAIITELLALACRMGGNTHEKMLAAVDERMRLLAEDGSL